MRWPAPALAAVASPVILRAFVIDASFLASVSHGCPAQPWESCACERHPALSTNQLKKTDKKKKKMLHASFKGRPFELS